MVQLGATLRSAASDEQLILGVSTSGLQNAVGSWGCFLLNGGRVARHLGEDTQGAIKRRLRTPCLLKTSEKVQ